MAELQAIKRRIRSVSSTRQLTKAMQLVAASKLRHAQTAAQAPVPYLEALQRLLGGLGAATEVAHHPLYARRPVRQALVIVITGDRGLAGGYNNNVFRALNQHIQNHKVPVQVINVGRRGAAHLAGVPDLDEVETYAMDNTDPDTGLAQPILAEALRQFTSGQVDVVHLIFTRFTSPVVQTVAVEQLLPVIPAEEAFQPSTLEPNLEIVLDTVVRRWLEAEVYQAVVESRASEQAARMMAMMNASDNAEKLVDDLTLARNNARQAAITQELAEISAGTEAVTNA